MTSISHRSAGTERTTTLFLPQVVRKLFLSTMLDMDMMLGLKVLRNAHLPSSVPVIRHFLLNVQLSTSVRMAAAQAMEKFWQPAVKTQVTSI